MLFDAVAHTLEANQPYVEIKITYRVVSNTVDCTFLPSELRDAKITHHMASQREVCFEKNGKHSSKNYASHRVTKRGVF